MRKLEIGRSKKRNNWLSQKRQRKVRRVEFIKLLRRYFIQQLRYISEQNARERTLRIAERGPFIAIDVLKRTLRTRRSWERERLEFDTLEKLLGPQNPPRVYQVYRFRR